MGVISGSVVLGAPAARKQNYHNKFFKRALNWSKIRNLLRYNFTYFNLHRIQSTLSKTDTSGTGTGYPS